MKKLHRPVFHLRPSALAVALAFTPAWVISQTLPTAPSVVQGSANVTRPGVGQMNVQQNSQNVVINWQSFSIGANGRVVFNQPNAQSVALNRVTGSDCALGWLKTTRPFAPIENDCQLMTTFCEFCCTFIWPAPGRVTLALPCTTLGAVGSVCAKTQTGVNAKATATSSAEGRSWKTGRCGFFMIRMPFELAPARAGRRRRSRTRAGRPCATPPRCAG